MEGKVVRGKTALVTGSTSGIGWSVATAPAERGGNIVANDFGEATAIAETRGSPASFGFACAAADLRSPPAAVGMITLTQTTWRFGGVGMGYPAPAINARNLFAAFFATTAAGCVHNATVVAAKPAVLRLAKAVALETAGRWRLGGAIGMRP